VHLCDACCVFNLRLILPVGIRVSRFPSTYVKKKRGYASCGFAALLAESLWLSELGPQEVRLRLTAGSAALLAESAWLSVNLPQKEARLRLGAALPHFLRKASGFPTTYLKRSEATLRGGFAALLAESLWLSGNLPQKK